MSHQHQQQSTTLQDVLEDGRFATLLRIEVPVSVRLGRCQLSLEELLSLSSGDRVTLDRLADEPVDILANDCLVARGEVVVIGGNFGVRITEIQNPASRLENLVD